MNVLNTFIKTEKDRLKKEEHGEVIYEINCLDCETSYVEQTKRKLNTRIKEYKADINNQFSIYRVSTPVG